MHSIISLICRGQAAPLSPRGAPPLEAGPVLPADVQDKIVSQSNRMYVKETTHTSTHGPSRTHAPMVPARLNRHTHAPMVPARLNRHTHILMHRHTHAQTHAQHTHTRTRTHAQTQKLFSFVFNCVALISTFDQCDSCDHAHEPRKSKAACRAAAHRQFTCS